MKIFRWLAFSALLMTSVSGANAQDVDKGSTAYFAGDYQTAFRELLPLAEGGDFGAQYLIGVMFRDGKGLIQSDFEAARWYRVSAEQGFSLAQCDLGIMYNTGRGVTESFAEAVKWFQLAADQGNAPCQAKLGTMYALGNGVIQNNVMAHMWVNIASANGEENSAALRDLIIAAKMTPEAIEKAQAMAQECISSGYKNCGE